MQATVNVNAEAQRVLAAGSCRWEQLGLPRGADFATVKARYKQLCALHPDKNLGNLLAAEAFAIVSAAYAELAAAAAAATRAAVHLQNSQPEALQSNRWQAFTNSCRQPYPQYKQQHAQPPPSQQQQQPPQHTFPGGGGCSQENRTPGRAGIPQPGPVPASGAWQASRWGMHSRSALLRAQPMAAGTVGGPGPGSGPGRTDKQAAVGGGAAGGQRSSSPPLDSPQSSICDDASERSSSDSAGDIGREAAADATGGWPSRVAVKPAAFYGPARNHTAQQSSPAVSGVTAAAVPPAPAAASLYAVFGKRRSSGGQPSSWVGSQQPPPQPCSQPPASQHPEPQSWRQQEHRLADGHSSQQQLEQASQPAAAGHAQLQQQPAPVAAAAPAASGPQAGSRWGSRSKLELLKHPVVPAASVADPRGTGGAHATAGEQPSRQARQSGDVRRAKRQQAVLSSSSSSSSSSGISSSDEGASSSREEEEEEEPDAAATLREELSQALAQQEAAARLAAQAAGRAIIERGRNKALAKYRRKKRQKKGASGAGTSGKQQSKLKLVPVRPAAA